MTATVTTEVQNTAVGLGGGSGVTSYTIDLSAVGTLAADQIIIIQVDCLTNVAGGSGAWNVSIPPTPWVRFIGVASLVCAYPSGTVPNLVVNDPIGNKLLAVAWHYMIVSGVNKNEGSSWFPGTGITALTAPVPRANTTVSSLSYQNSGFYNPSNVTQISISPIQGYLTLMFAGPLGTPGGAPTATTALGASTQSLTASPGTLWQVWGHGLPTPSHQLDGTISNINNHFNGFALVFQVAHLKPDDTVLSKDLTGVGPGQFDWTSTPRSITLNPNAAGTHGAFQGTLGVCADNPGSATSGNLEEYDDVVSVGTNFCTVVDPGMVIIVVVPNGSGGWFQVVNEAYNPAKIYTFTLARYRPVTITIYTTSATPSGAISLHVDTPKALNRGSSNIQGGSAPDSWPAKIGLSVPINPAGKPTLNIGDTVVLVVQLYSFTTTLPPMLMAAQSGWTLIRQEAFFNGANSATKSLNIFTRPYEGSMGYVINIPAIATGGGVFNPRTGVLFLYGIRDFGAVTGATSVVKSPPTVSGGSTPEPTFPSPSSITAHDGITYSSFDGTLNAPVSGGNGGYIYNGANSKDSYLSVRPTASLDTSPTVARNPLRNPGSPNTDTLADIIFGTNCGTRSYNVGAVAVVNVGGWVIGLPIS